MEPRLSLVTLAVDDLARSKGFYQALGWAPGFSNDDVCFFQMQGLVLGLWRKASMAEAHAMRASDLGPGGMELAHNVAAADDVDQVFEALRKAGAQVVTPPHTAPWGGRTATVRDPDGYRWEIAWNPAWRLAPDGTWLA